MIPRNLLIKLGFLSILLITVSSCEKFSGSQTIPAYLSIDSIYLITNYYTQGSASQRITDAWVSVDDEFLGAYELPCKFPVLKTGKHKVKIWSGIKKDGIAATRASYEFYSPVEMLVNFAQDSTSRLGTLKTSYQSSTLFTWKEDFEDVALTIDTTAGSSAYFQRTAVGSPLTFEGNHSGLIELDSAHDFLECYTHTMYAIPNSAVFLEMNFNTTNAVTVGVFTYGTTTLYQTPIITLNTTGGAWKKIYIDLTTTLNAYSGMKNYRVYLSALKESGKTKSSILVDNFKVVTR